MTSCVEPPLPCSSRSLRAGRTTPSMPPVPTRSMSRTATTAASSIPGIPPRTAATIPVELTRTATPPPPRSTRHRRYSSRAAAGLHRTIDGISRAAADRPTMASRGTCDYWRRVIDALSIATPPAIALERRPPIHVRGTHRLRSVQALNGARPSKITLSRSCRQAAPARLSGATPPARRKNLTALVPSLQPGACFCRSAPRGRGPRWGAGRRSQGALAASVPYPYPPARRLLYRAQPDRDQRRRPTSRSPRAAR